MKKTNLLFITTDQQRQDSLPCYGLDVMKTKNLDWLSENGTVFTQCYVTAPICVASRSSLMSGQYPSVNGTIANDTWLDESTPVWPELISREGYKTAGIGKMHFSPWDNLCGFNERIICEDKRHYYIQDDHVKFLEKHGLTRPSPIEYPEYYETLGAPYYIHEKKFHPDEFVANKAVEWFETNGDEPFAAWVSFPSPHDPYDPPKEMKALYENVDFPDPIPCDLTSNPMLRMS